MAVVVKTFEKVFNSAKLQEELQAALVGPQGITWAGFDRLDDRRYQPAPGPRVISRVTINGVVTEDIAQPGELRFVYENELTPEEDGVLDGVLGAHDAALLTLLQQEEDQDAVDFDELLLTTFPEYKVDISELQAQLDLIPNNPTKQALQECRQMFTKIRKLFRVVIRSQRGDSVVAG